MTARPATRGTSRPARGRKRLSIRSVIYLVLGMLVLLTPVVLTQIKNVEQNRIAQNYSRDVATLDTAERDEILRRAREYSATLPEFGAPDPWVHGADTQSPGYRDYASQLDVNGVMARLRVPSVGMDLPVYHGTSQQTLAHGVGHLYGTALPVGGEGTHAVLTGHTGLATLSMFDNLTHMEDDDIFTVEVAGETLAYQVFSIETVLPSEIENIRPEAGRDLVTLVTCTPYGINTHRLLVHAERTELPDGEIDREYRSPWQPWMIAAVIISLLVFIYLLWFLLRRRRDDNERTDQATS